MVQEGLGLVFVLGAGALLLRPRDFPLFARAAGRLVGLTVRSMRATKDAAERAIKESADNANLQNPEMIVMRENLKRSYNKFESLATTVRRDIADVPLNPSLLLRKGWRSLESVTNDPVHPAKDVNNRQIYEGNTTSKSLPQTGQVRGNTYSVSRNVSPIREGLPDLAHNETDNKLMSGADVMIRAIEDAALARHELYIFAKTKHSKKRPIRDESSNPVKGMSKR